MSFHYSTDIPSKITFKILFFFALVTIDILSRITVFLCQILSFKKPGRVKKIFYPCLQNQWPSWFYVSGWTEKVNPYSCGQCSRALLRLSNYASGWVFPVSNSSCAECKKFVVMEALSNSLDMPAFKITNQPKTSENKTQTQNSAHEGIKFHQPNFFQTSSDMCWWISESFINLGQFLDMEMNFWMKLVPPKNVTKSGCFSSNIFANAKFSSRRNGSLVFKLL